MKYLALLLIIHLPAYAGKKKHKTKKETQLSEDQLLDMAIANAKKEKSSQKDEDLESVINEEHLKALSKVKPDTPTKKSFWYFKPVHKPVTKETQRVDALAFTLSLKYIDKLLEVRRDYKNTKHNNPYFHEYLSNKSLGHYLFLMEEASYPAIKGLNQREMQDSRHPNFDDYFATYVVNFIKYIEFFEKHPKDKYNIRETMELFSIHPDYDELKIRSNIIKKMNLPMRLTTEDLTKAKELAIKDIHMENNEEKFTELMEKSDWDFEEVTYRDEDEKKEHERLMNLFQEDCSSTKEVILVASKDLKEIKKRIKIKKNNSRILTNAKKIVDDQEQFLSKPIDKNFEKHSKILYLLNN